MKELKKLKNNKKIEAIYLFGSQATNTANPLSDIDICIFGKFSNDEKSKVYSLLGEKYDISFFEDLPTWVKIRVFREGKALFIRNKSHLYDYLFNTIREYEDFLPLIKRRVIEKFGTWQI